MPDKIKLMLATHTHGSVTPAYAQALARVRAAIVEASVTVDVIDVGGGFPSIYPGMEPPPLEDYFGAMELISAAKGVYHEQLSGIVALRQLGRQLDDIDNLVCEVMCNKFVSLAIQWEDTTSTAANGTMPNNEPRRVRTLAVKGDAADNGGVPAGASAPRPAPTLEQAERAA